MDKHDVVYKVYIKERCPYCDERLRFVKHLKLDTGWWEEIFSCRKCHKSFKIKISMGDDNFLFSVSAKEINYSQDKNGI